MLYCNESKTKHLKNFIAWLPHCQENQEKSEKTIKKDKCPEKSGENGGFRKKVMKSQEIWYKNAVNKKVYHH